MIGLDFYEQLPNDYGKIGKAFKPYKQKAQKTIYWIRGNALPIALFAAGLVIA